MIGTVYFSGEAITGSMMVEGTGAMQTGKQESFELQQNHNCQRSVSKRSKEVQTVLPISEGHPS